MIRPSSRELVKALAADGFVLDRTKGSHQTWRKTMPDGRHRSVTVVLDKKETPAETMRSILRQWGLTEDELRDRL